jgi:hypothetical protein
MSKSWVGFAISAIVVLPPFIMGFVPIVASFVARSRWTPVAWVAALAIGTYGCMLDRNHLLPDHRLAAIAWIPVYQLFVFTLATNVFFLALHRRPRYVPSRFAPGYG